MHRRSFLLGSTIAMVSFATRSFGQILGTLENIDNRGLITLRQRVNKEFQTGQVKLVDGWLVSETEYKIIKDQTSELPIDDLPHSRACANGGPSIKN